MGLLRAQDSQPRSGDKPHTIMILFILTLVFEAIAGRSSSPTAGVVVAVNFTWAENLLCVADSVGARLFVSENTPTPTTGITRVQWINGVYVQSTHVAAADKFSMFAGLALDPSNSSGFYALATLASSSRSGLGVASSKECAVLRVATMRAESYELIATLPRVCGGGGLGFHAGSLYAASEGEFVPDNGEVFRVDIASGEVNAVPSSQKTYANDGLWIEQERKLLIVGSLGVPSKVRVYDLASGSASVPPLISTISVAGVEMLDDFTLLPASRSNGSVVIIGAGTLSNSIVAITLPFASNGSIPLEAKVAARVLLKDKALLNGPTSARFGCDVAGAATGSGLAPTLLFVSQGGPLTRKSASEDVVALQLPLLLPPAAPLLTGLEFEAIAGESGSQSIYSLLDPQTLLPKNKSFVLAGCVGQNCSLTGATKREPTRHSGEGILHRRYDLHVSFIQPQAAILNLTDDPLRLQHYSWQICRGSMNDTCRWDQIADGEFDDSLLIPAARHIIASLSKPIVLALCNEMNSKSFANACPLNVSRYSTACSDSYKRMYAHVKDVFEREGVNSDASAPRVVWSWQTFNEGGEPEDSKRMWDQWYVGDDNVSWVGVNAFNELNAADPSGANFTTVRELFEPFYEWTQSKHNVHPFFHAFGTDEKPGHAGWKKAWLEALPGLLGPTSSSSVFPSIRAAVLYCGENYDIQTSGEAIAGAVVAMNAPVFNAFSHVNRTAALCCGGAEGGDAPETCCWEYGPY